MNSYINTLREMLDKYESKPEVYNKLIVLEAKKRQIAKNTINKKPKEFNVKTTDNRW